MSDSRRHTASSLAYVPSTLRSVRPCLAWLSNIGAGEAALAAGDDGA
jgi:hypothetical protein